MDGFDARRAEPGPTATSLVLGVKALDPDAWRRFAALYGPLIYGWVRRAGLGSEDAADVAQDVFRAVAAAAPRVRHGGPGDTLRGWLWSVTRNRLRDFWRARTGRPVAAGGTDAQERLLLVAEPDTDGGPDGPSDSAALVRRASELVRAEFEPRTWDAFWRVTIDGHAPADVARDLGLTANAVYVARSRVLRRLRDVLAGDLGGPTDDEPRAAGG